MSKDNIITFDDIVKVVKNKGVVFMKCKFCGEEVKPTLFNTDAHRKQKEWDCPKCGIIKNQSIIDGEIMRVYIKEKGDK